MRHFPIRIAEEVEQAIIWGRRKVSARHLSRLRCVLFHYFFPLVVFDSSIFPQSLPSLSNSIIYSPHSSVNIFFHLILRVVTRAGFASWELGWGFSGLRWPPIGLFDRRLHFRFIFGCNLVVFEGILLSLKTGSAVAGELYMGIWASIYVHPSHNACTYLRARDFAKCCVGTHEPHMECFLAQDFAFKTGISEGSRLCWQVFHRMRLKFVCACVKGRVARMCWDLHNVSAICELITARTDLKPRYRERSERYCGGRSVGCGGAW